VTTCCFVLVVSLAAATGGQTTHSRTVTRATSPQADIAIVNEGMATRPGIKPEYDTAATSTVPMPGSPAGVGTARSVSAGPQLGSSLTEKLWRSRIVAPDPNEDAETRLALARLIKQIRSVQFEPDEQHSAFSMPTEPEQPKPSDTVDNTIDDAWEDTTKPTSAPPPASETRLPAETEKALRHLIQNPDRVEDPFELAELLFLSGQRTEAAVFYQKALDLMDMEAATTHEDRAWILFQLGNCLRETNITQAKDIYVKLIAEYPNSPWTELAKAHGRLITWYQKAKPTQLVNGP
jgi:hypothetical protein